MGFDSKSYETMFIKPLRGKTKLPDDLFARYAMSDGVRTDAEVAEQLRAVRSYWNTGSSKPRTAFICNLCKAADEDLQQTHADMATLAF